MTRPLSFDELDGLSFAAARGKLKESTNIHFNAEELGPFLEYAMLSASQLLPRAKDARWLSLGELHDIYIALRTGRQSWVCPSTRMAGLFLTSKTVPADEARWIQFSVAAHKAALMQGFPSDTTAQLVAAIGEMQSNIYEHSGASETGFVAFKAKPKTFEFVVADRGMGVLASLKSCVEYSILDDHGEALRVALTDGSSRYGEGSGRGRGFRPLFTGLANLNGSLRFRSGDQALIIEGTNPLTIPAKLAQKVLLSGFFVSITCGVI